MKIGEHDSGEDESQDDLDSRGAARAGDSKRESVMNSCDSISYCSRWKIGVNEGGREERERGLEKMNQVLYVSGQSSLSLRIRNTEPYLSCTVPCVDADVRTDSSGS